MRVLLVEPDAATAEALEIMLKTEGMNVYTTDLGDEAIDLGKSYDYDAIVLELNLPDLSGYEVIRTLRTEKIRTPILILSGIAGIEDKVRAFSFGADDYLTKPFHKDELVARLHAIVRRSHGQATPVVEVGLLRIDVAAQTVHIDGKPIHLTTLEYRMLALLAQRKGVTLSKEVFMNHLYGGMDEPCLKIIDVFVCKLRRKITAASGGPAYIETVWGRGYVLREPDGDDDRYVKHPKRPPHLAEVSSLANVE